MIRGLVALALILLPAAAGAETISVGSGEHDDFSRLLLKFPRGANWEFGRVDGGFEFRAESNDIEYELRYVYDLIPRTRIADIEDRGEGRLFLRVDCECHGDAFDLQKGQVVLDIKDGVTAISSSPFERSLVPIGPSLPDTESGAAMAIAAGVSIEPLVESPALGVTRSLRPMEARAGLPLMVVAESDRSGSAGFAPTSPADGGVGEESSAVVASVHSPDDPLPESATVMPHPESAPPPDRVLATESALLEQIARAAAQGLLDADLDAVVVEAAETTTPTGSAPPNESAAAFSPLPAVTPRGHLSVETSVDRAFGGGNDRAADTDEGHACIDPAQFAIADWGGPMDDGADLGEYRSELVGEFDIANGQGITELAHHYLYITFGAEAKALVTRYPADVERADLVLLMADIMDRGYSESALSLVDQLACDGPVALWAALAQPELFRGQSIDASAVALAFGSLPAHLRRHLGPDLAQKFLDIGDTTTAEMIRDSAGRTLEEPDGRFELLSARADLAAGLVETATEALDRVVAKDGEVLPEALLERANTAFSEGQPVPENVVSLLGSVAYERRGTSLGLELKAAEIRALASVPDFETAFSELASMATHAEFAEVDIARLETEVFRRLAQDASDATFLRFAVGGLAHAQTLPAEERRLLAGRFLDLGLSAPARQILGGEGVLPEKDDRYLFARAALIEERPDIAISYLAGLEDDQAKRLRAQALDLAQDHPSAMRAYQELGDTSAQRRVAWQGGLWEDIARIDDGVEAEAGRLMSGEMAQAPGSEGRQAVPPLPTTPLAKTAALLEASQAARATLDMLLQGIAIPSASD